MTHRQSTRGRWLVCISIGLLLVFVLGLTLKFNSRWLSEVSKRVAARTETEADSNSADNGASRIVNTSQAARQLSDLSGAIALKVMPSLVAIYVTRGANIESDKEMESYFGQLPIAKTTDIGSGFFVESGSWVLTNYHVVRSAMAIRLVGPGGKSWSATVHASDALSDLSILKVTGGELPSIDWGEIPLLRAGNFVWVAGAPFGLERSISFGIVSSMERSSMNGSPLREYIQTDASINPGQSGGPMLDIDGKVVGVVTSILGEQYQGIGFALPGDTAQYVARQLIENKKVVRGWIGAQLGQVTPERARKANTEGLTGAYIEWLDPGDSDRVPAKKAGLAVGDICTGCDNMRIASQFDLARKIGLTLPGRSLKLELVRNSKTTVVEVLVAEKP